MNREQAEDLVRDSMERWLRADEEVTNLLARLCAEQSNGLRLVTSRDHWRNLALVLIAALCTMVAALWILREVAR